MIFDTDQWFSLAEIAEEYGLNKRTLARAAKRAGIEAKVFYGVTLHHIDDVDKILEHTYPVGTDRRALLAKLCGSRGGATKAANSRARAASSGRRGERDAGS